MVKKKKRLENIDIRKRRKELLKLKREKLDQEKEQRDKELDALEKRLAKETNLYWVRAITGVLSALVGRLFFGLVGWWLFLWMIGFWIIPPFLFSFFVYQYEYDEEEWNWKNIIKPGLGIYFFLFMIIGTIIHTFLLFL